jgi:hypothetical protein
MNPLDELVLEYHEWAQLVTKQAEAGKIEGLEDGRGSLQVEDK